MPRYSVTFTQYFSYTVDEESEEDALYAATREFESEMRRPVARTDYDDVEIALADED